MEVLCCPSLSCPPSLRSSFTSFIFGLTSLSSILYNQRYPCHMHRPTNVQDIKWQDFIRVVDVFYWREVGIFYPLRFFLILFWDWRHTDKGTKTIEKRKKTPGGVFNKKKLDDAFSIFDVVKDNDFLLHYPDMISRNVKESEDRVMIFSQWCKASST